MNLLLVILAFAGIAAFDLPDMLKSKRRRDLVVYGIVFVMVLALGVLLALNVKIPSPIKMIQAFYKDVLGLSFKPPS